MKRFFCLLFASVLLLSAAACNAPTSDHSQEPVPPSDQPNITPEIRVESATPAEPEPWVWPVSEPDEQGLDADALPAIHEDYDSFPLLSAMIIRNGSVVDTYFKDGYDETTRFVLNSASKSVTSALIGIAIQEGYIHSVDDLLSDYLPRVKDLPDDRWQQITLRHLLTHTSGIATTDNALWNEWRSSENWVEYILALPITSAPGAVFDYSTGNTHLLTAVLQAATGTSMYDFGVEHLFEPLDMDSVSIEEDPQGIADGGNGIWMTTADMAKIGELFLHDGAWNGRQVVPAEWVAESTSLQFDRSSGSADYGYQWWVRTFGEARYPAFFAQGHAGQYIFVVPDLELVVAFNSDYEGSTSIYWQLVNDIVAACSEEIPARTASAQADFPEVSENTVATAIPTPHEGQILYLWEEGNVPATTEYTVNNGNYSDDPDFLPTVTFFPVPEGMEIKGAVLVCAGGAFQFRSDNNEGTPVAEALAQRGYQSFVVDYRLRPYTQEEGALDLARAVRFVRSHAEEYGIDEKDIAVMGFSAGGILAGEMLRNYDGTVSPATLDPDYIPDELDTVSADAAADGMIYSFYGRLSVGTTDVDSLREADLPPTFYCYGTEDPFYRQFLANADAVEEAGTPVTRLQLDGMPHGFGYQGGWMDTYAQWLSDIIENN